MKLQWKLKVNTDELTVWQAGPYILQGKGRPYGGGIRRDWSLWRGRTHLTNPTRLSQGKQWAQQDCWERDAPDLETVIGQLLKIPKYESVQLDPARYAQMIQLGQERGFISERLVGGVRDHGRYWLRLRTREEETTA